MTTSKSVKTKGSMPKRTKVRSGSKPKPRALRKRFSINAFLGEVAKDLDIPQTDVKFVAGALRARDFTALKVYIDSIASPQKYCDASEYYRFAQFAHFVKKLPITTSEVTRKAAKVSFLTAEAQCAETNLRFRKKDFAFEYIQVFDKAQRIIARVLGDMPMDSILEHARHGPGGALGTDAHLTTSFYKDLKQEWTCGSGASLYASSVLQDIPYVHASLVKTDSNRVAFVPKTMWTDRTIAVEPLLNVFLQLGVGEVMKQRLNRIGIDLRDQTNNQLLAGIASVNGRYATLDLKAASDTISYQLVVYLFRDSPEWLDLMLKLRSPCYSWEEETRRYEKFSSMGCGFTFELETLIFYALSVAVSECLGIETHPLVYGDDIVIHSDIYPFLVDVLNVCGFSANEEKSFSQGPFRESCGSDFWSGVNVRPFVLDFIPTKWEQIYLMVNSLNQDSHIFFESSIRYLLDLLPEKAKTILGPTLETPQDRYIECTLPTLYSKRALRWDKGLQCLMHSALTTVPRDYLDLHKDDHSQYVAYHYAIRRKSETYDLIAEVLAAQLRGWDKYIEPDGTPMKITRRDSVHIHINKKVSLRIDFIPKRPLAIDYILSQG